MDILHVQDTYLNCTYFNHSIVFTLKSVVKVYFSLYDSAHWKRGRAV